MVAILVRKVVANGSSNMARNVLGSPVLRCGAFKHMADALDEEAEPISHIEGGALGYDQQAQDIRKIALIDRRQTQIFAEHVAIRRLFRVRTFGANESPKFRIIRGSARNRGCAVPVCPTPPHLYRD